MCSCLEYVFTDVVVVLVSEYALQCGVCRVARCCLFYTSMYVGLFVVSCLLFSVFVKNVHVFVSCCLLCLCLHVCLVCLVC